MQWIYCIVSLATAGCPENSLTCTDNITCVAPSKVCDGYPDCDGSFQSTDEYQHAECNCKFRYIHVSNLIGRTSFFSLTVLAIRH